MRNHLVILVICLSGCDDFSSFMGHPPLDMVSVEADADSTDLASSDFAGGDLAQSDFARAPDLVRWIDMACPGATTYCDGSCVNVETNPENCGMCGKVCRQGMPYCAAGTCTDLIPSGKPCPNGVSGMCQTMYCSSQLICTNRAKGDPCGVNGDCLSAKCGMGICQ